MRALVAACLALALLPAVASASRDQQIGIADDAVLLYGSDAAARQAVTRWEAIGIDTVRLHARWIAIAPNPNSQHQPVHFHAADQHDPHYNWGALDRAVYLLHSHGIRAMVAITGSGPVWASQNPRRHDPRWKPSPRKFAYFARAVAKRYRDSVDDWIVWNEPNHPGWLQPQFHCGGGRCRPVSPDLYRQLYRAGSRAIRIADPGSRVYMGALAPIGKPPVSYKSTMSPLTFIRRLGCVDGDYRRVRDRGCHTRAPLVADGFAYHPHAGLRPPDVPTSNPDDATIADLGRLETVLDRTTANGILRPRDDIQFKLYLTEFGYRTHLPRNRGGVSLRRQAAWLARAAYRTWQDPRVACLIQYEWLDEPPTPSRVIGKGPYKGWQSGLLTADGKAKPALKSFVAPFIVTREGRGARFWGQVRPGARHTVTIEHRLTAAGPWKAVADVTTDVHGAFELHLPLVPAGGYRFTSGPIAADDLPVTSTVLLLSTTT